MSCTRLFDRRMTNFKAQMTNQDQNANDKKHAGMMGESHLCIWQNTQLECEQVKYYESNTNKRNEKSNKSKRPNK